MVVSSTRIRELVAAGELREASRLLGRQYGLAGAVVPGDRLGRQLGFPTANLQVTGMILPPHGVYAARVHVGAQTWLAAVNIGTRPTVDPQAAIVRVEAHLLDFDGDLYGQQLELEMGERLRPEMRLGSRDALVCQIQQDLLAVRAWAGK